MNKENSYKDSKFKMMSNLLSVFGSQTVVNLRASQMLVNFLKCLMTISLSRTTLNHGVIIHKLINDI